MNSLTVMQTQPLPSSRNLEPRIRSATIAPISLFNTGRSANKVSLKSPSSGPAVRSPDRTEKTIPLVAAVAAPRPLSAGQGFMMDITIDASFVTQLRHLVMGTCGELVEFIRIQPLAHATRMRVWLCLSKRAIDLIMDAVMRTLPSAEFGRITHA